MTYADVLHPSAKRYSLLYDIVLIAGGSLFIALFAQIAIRIPFSPIPVTGQTLAVLLIGALLGSRRGSMCVLLYLAEGSIGFPVFAGGMAGFTHLLGPCGGYLMGFVGGAFLTGLLAEKGWDRRVSTAFLAMLIGNATIYAFGLFWLVHLVGSERVLVLGLLPFIPGDILKLVLAAILLPSGWKLLGSISPVSGLKP